MKALLKYIVKAIIKVYNQRKNKGRENGMKRINDLKNSKQCIEIGLSERANIMRRFFYCYDY